MYICFFFQVVLVLQRALEIREIVLDSDYFIVVRFYYQLVGFYVQWGKFFIVEVFYKQVLDIYVDRYGFDYYLVVKELDVFVVLYQKQDK